LETYAIALKGGRVSEQSQVITGAMIGALVGAAAAYLFFTEGGRGFRERVEPAVDGLRDEFQRFKGVVEKLGDMANEGMRVVNEFQTARAQSPFAQSRTSH
jgi:gas vesicle protein